MESTTMMPADSAAPAQKPPAGPFPWVTVVLIAVNLGVFGCELMSGLKLEGNNADLLVSLGGNYPPRTLGGESWRLVTSMFLNFQILQLVLNCICIAQVRAAERVFGRFGYVSIYLVGGLLGGVASLVHIAPNAVAAGGASGVFALYGAFLAFLFVRKKQLEPVSWKTSLRSIGLFLAINLIYVLGASHVDPSPFFGGLVAGAIVGVGLAIGVPTARTLKLRAAAAVIAGVAITATAVCALPAPEVTASYAFLGANAKVLADYHALDRQTVPKLTANRAMMTEVNGIERSANQLEAEIVPPWLALRAEVASAKVPPEHQALFAALARVIAADLGSFDAMIQANRDIVHAEKWSAALEAHAAEALTAKTDLRNELRRLQGN